MSDSRIIISWISVFVVLGFPLIVFVINRITLRIAWKDQADLRSKPPEQYQTWRSGKTNKVYYITSGPTEFNHGITVSTGTSGRGGLYYTLKEWSDLVNRERLIKVPKS